MATKKTREEYSSPYQQLSKDALDKWQNREKYSYDLNADELYNQYKNNFIQQGKLAMKDTMGQAASLTGGYGNTYAQTVGQQTYQGYLQKLNEIVPQLYEADYARYQQEGDDLYRQWQTLQSLEAQDYDRFVTERQFEADQAYRNWQMSRGSGSSTSKKNVAYDNGNVSTEQIAKMQKALGLNPTGYWDEVSYMASGGMTADEALYSWDNGALVADEAYVNNYLAQTPETDTDYNYSYVGGMYTPSDELPERDREIMDGWVKTMVDSYYSDRDLEAAWKKYEELRNKGYDVSEYDYIFPDDFIEKKLGNNK